MADELPEGTPTGIVQAVGIISASVGNDPTARTERVKAIEAAMMAALQEAQADGVTDPDEQRRRMLEARDKVLAE